MSVKTIWKEGMYFEGVNEYNQIVPMEPHNDESKQRGPTPMELVLYALTGCTAFDVIGIAKKMRQDVQEFSVESVTERSEEHPKVYTKIHLIYRFKGKDLDKDKLERAIWLSKNNYCSVSAMLKCTAELSHVIVIE